MHYSEFKKNHLATMNLQGEYISDYSEAVGANDGRSPVINLSSYGRTTRSQTNLYASISNQADYGESGLSATGSNQGASSTKSQRAPATPVNTSTYTVSPSPSGSYPFTGTNATNSPSSSQNVPYPRKVCFTVKLPPWNVP
ncbi:hypothetical protein DSO57_1008122 [Entomophthora muscae]|uniref:Uncharacterized protein n=1 Tax=Entomophthora muscae TaxID=34485 RepID=A0ACC2TU84_9FUNG|nr:hypothetical protein DSO57_1008122 [Entomophthora muscae]